MELLSGIDMIEVSKVNELLSSQGKSFVESNFSAGEQAYCESRKKMRQEHYAGRLAVKRAFLKALGRNVNEFLLNEIEISRERGHMPQLEIPEALRTKLGLLAQDRVLVSLAHERELAVGVVVVVKR